MKNLTAVQHYFLPRPLVIITIWRRKLHAIVMVQPVSSCAVVSAHLKSVVVVFFFDVKITKINTKNLVVVQLHQSFSICVCVVQLQQLFSLISQDGWLNFSTNIQLSTVYILDVEVYSLNSVVLS